MSDVERSDGSNQAAPWRPPLSLILVSVLAAVAAIVHMAFPSLTIDGVTLGCWRWPRCPGSRRW